MPQLTSLHEGTFSKCSSLESAVIPKVASIEESAFEDCTKISSISLFQTPPAVGKDAFKNCPEKRSIILADADGKALIGEALKAAQDAYKADAGYNAETKLWNGFSLDTSAPVTEGKRTKALDFTASSIEKQADTTSWGDPTKENIDALAAEGWAWDFASQTLTLDGADIAFKGSSSYAIELPKESTSTILLKGSNQITCEGKRGISSNGSIVIKNAGTNNASLTIDSGSYAIFSMKHLDIKGITLNATSKNSTAITTSLTESILTISGRGTVVTAVSSGSAGIYSSNVVISDGAKVSATSNPNANGLGISCTTKGSITFSGAATVVKSTGSKGALKKEPICNDGIVANGGTWESVNTEVTWKNPGASSGSGSSGGGSRDTSWKSVPANYSGETKSIGNTIVPVYTVEGKWSQNANGGWSFIGNDGTKYAGTWVAAYNPYAVRGKGQNAFDWFVFDAAGNMLTGWFKDADGNTYYLNQNSDNTLGAMQTGWVLIVGNYYYFNDMPDNTRGRMLRNTRTPDGYYVNENGVRVNDGQQ